MIGPASVPRPPRNAIRATATSKSAVKPELGNEKHGNGDDHKGVAARAQGNRAQRDGDGPGDQPADGQQEEWTEVALDVPVLADDGQRVRADAEEHGMAEGDVAGVAREDIPCRRRRRVDDREDGDGGDCRIREYQWAGNRRRQQEEQRERSIPHHCFLPASCPNRPCGRTSSTSTSRMKKTRVDNVADQSAAVTSSTTSMAKEAISAPPRLPMPPSTMMTSRREMRS